MKKILMSLLCAWSALSAWADEPLSHLTLWSKDGATVGYALSEKPKVTFTEENLIIETEKVRVEYLLDNLLRLTYEHSDLTGIEDLTNGEAFEWRQEALVFPSLAPGSRIAIYRVDGTMIWEHTVNEGGHYACQLGQLPKGNYLVKVNQTAYKIRKQ